MKKHLILLTLVLGINTLFFAQGKDQDCAIQPPHKDHFLLHALPATIKVGDNVYVDVTETSIFAWMDYLRWNKRVFGKQSKEYLQDLPDTTVWGNFCLTDFATLYFRHPKYEQYPIVGVTAEQASRFLQWKADRVMEKYLVKSGVIAENSNPLRIDYFSIEKWLTGKFPTLKKAEDIAYYPVCHLPSLTSFKLALHHNDSINKKNPEKMDAGLDPCGKILIEPTKPVQLSNFKSNTSVLNLKGNVSEWSNEPGIALGGSWNDAKAVVVTQDTFHLKQANAQTGCRGVWEWKKFTH